MAAVGVLVVHMGQRLELSGVLRRITDIGAYGVYIFFVISGFLAFASSEKYKFNDREEIVRYYKARFIRIIPLYYSVILYYFVMHTFVWKDVPVDQFYGLGWLRYIFFLNIFCPYDNVFWGNIGATWTINIFVLFYAIVPILKKYITNFRRSIVVCLFFYLLKNYDIPYITDTSIDSLYVLMLGIVMYYTYREGKEKITYLLLGGLLLICCLVGVKDMAFIFTLFFCIVLLQSYRWDISCLELQKTVNKLDEYSYDLYLVHAIFIELIDKYKMYVGLNDLFSKIVILLIGILGSIFGCLFIHKVVEKPIQRILNEKMANAFGENNG